MADQAVVVGIQHYPGMSDLQGPCNDAILFRDWLIDPNGGALDPQNVGLSLTTDYPVPANLNDARPVLSDLETLFRPLITQAAQAHHQTGRLFIYVAGHGFADPRNTNSAALFTANAEILFPLHLAVMHYVNFLQRTWAFDELIVVMDSCRTTTPLNDISTPALPNVASSTNAHKVKVFTGFGAGYGQVSRERPFSGNHHGIFTMTLINALKNASPNRLGRVTGSSIKSYIHNNIGKFAGDVEIAPPDINVDQDKDVLFVARDAVTTDVVFEISPELHNKELIVAFGGHTEVFHEIVTSSPLSIPLEPGLYKAYIEGTTTSSTFEVPRDGNINL
ncbi:MAG: caspase family protein [Desulfuromonadales bacterium]|nr:caspase family protein [Desulfuromonadales bacterium]